MTHDHESCWLDENCGADDCPAVVTNRMRAAARGREWGPLVLSQDAGGQRHVLDGKPVHCGAMIQLQACETRDDDRGSYMVYLQRGTLVRYEAALHLDPPVVRLFGDLSGYEFSAVLGMSMRFRWPGAATS